MAVERSRKGSAAKGRRPARKTHSTKKTKPKTTRRGEARKERVLHTRISEKLAGDIYRVAEDLRVPASNLVRNVLEDAFSVVESVTDNVGDLIENVLSEAERARERITQSVERTRQSVRGSMNLSEDDSSVQNSESEGQRPDFPDVLGWQPMVANSFAKLTSPWRESAVTPVTLISVPQTAAAAQKYPACDPSDSTA